MQLLETLRRPGHQLRAAEIGVCVADTSSYLLEQVPDLFLVMVDAWRAADPDGAWAKSRDNLARRSQADMDQWRDDAKLRTDFAQARRLIIALPSIEAAVDVPNGSLDLVFIDAEHTYDAVKADIAAWLPKVRSGGILAGHDYGSMRKFAGVKHAVDEWAAATGRTVEVMDGKVWFCRID